MEDFIGKYDGNQIDSRLDKVKDMVGATDEGQGAGLARVSTNLAPSATGRNVGSRLCFSPEFRKTSA